MPTATRRSSTPSLLTSAYDRFPSDSEILITGEENEDDKGRTARRRVTFNEDVFVRTCLHIGDYSNEEAKACWYRRSELSRLKAEIAPTVMKWRRGEAMPDDMCFRGLETRPRECAIQRKHIKVQALLSVLQQQHRQQMSESVANGDEEIAAKYTEKTQRAKKDALAMGLNDAEEASKIHEEDQLYHEEESIRDENERGSKKSMNTRAKRVMQMIRRR